MIFIDWAQMLFYSLPALMAAASLLLWWIVRSANLWIKASVRIVSVLLASITLLFILALVAASFFGRTIHHPPQYSADRKFALRVTDFDYGATGGQSEVEIYTLFGLRQDTIYFGDWKQVEPRDVQWVGAREVNIFYHGSEPPRTCNGAFGVVVHCEQALEPVHHD